MDRHTLQAFTVSDAESNAELTTYSKNMTKLLHSYKHRRTEDCNMSVLIVVSE